MATTLARSRVARSLYLVLGLLSLAIALIGIVLPTIPTTGPTLLAAWAFSRSSERFDAWLLRHRLFGPIVRDWRAGLGFSVRAKLVAVVAIAATFTVTVLFAVERTGVRVALVALAAAIAAYVITRPTKRTA